jgi:hypothetical protein
MPFTKPLQQQHQFRRYKLYGLHVSSDRALPGLVALAASPFAPSQAAAPLIGTDGAVGANGTDGIDIHLWFDVPAPVPSEVVWEPHSRFTNRRAGVQVEAARMLILATSDGAFTRLQYNDGVIFTIDQAATHIWCAWPSHFSLEYVLSYITNPVMGLCLRLRDQVCLHASAIDLGGAALLISAPSGYGKSTTAAYFALRGHSIITDDISVLSLRRDQSHQGSQSAEVFVTPGYPHLRLWDEPTQLLLGATDALPRIAPDWEKRYLDLDQDGWRFATAALPVKAVCLLTPRQLRLAIHPAPPGLALVALMENTYMNYLIDNRLRALDFAVLSQVVASATMRFVSACDSLDQLPALYTALISLFETA